MNTKNVLISGIVGGIAYFFLGWLIYGILLMDYMESISPFIAGVNRPESEFIWWAMIVSNLLTGIFIAFILDIGKVSGWMNAAKTGAIAGFLVSCSFDLNFYAMTNMVSRRAMLVDVIASTIMIAIGAIIIVLVMDQLRKKS